MPKITKKMLPVASLLRLPPPTPPNPPKSSSLPTQTGSHYRGSCPIADGHLTHRWQLQMNHKQAAVRLDPAGFAQMFISHSPAVPRWEVVLQSFFLFFSFSFPNPSPIIFSLFCHRESHDLNSVWHRRRMLHRARLCTFFLPSSQKKVWGYSLRAEASVGYEKV